MILPLWLIGIALYLGGHLLLYCLIMRRLPLFARENVIFLYHALSTAVVVAVAFGLALARGSPTGWLIGLAVTSLHGIYSLSFLELWSLAEGSYSLSILAAFGTPADGEKGIGLAALDRIGSRKRASRLESLGRLGLVRARGDRWELTSRGRAVAAGLSLVAWLANLKKLG